MKTGTAIWSWSLKSHVPTHRGHRFKKWKGFVVTSQMLAGCTKTLWRSPVYTSIKQNFAYPHLRNSRFLSPWGKKYLCPNFVLNIEVLPRRNKIARFPLSKADVGQYFPPHVFCSSQVCNHHRRLLLEHVLNPWWSNETKSVKMESEKKQEEKPESTAPTK